MVVWWCVVWCVSEDSDQEVCVCVSTTQHHLDHQNKKPDCRLECVLLRPFEAASFNCEVIKWLTKSLDVSGTTS